MDNTEIAAGTVSALEQLDFKRDKSYNAFNPFEAKNYECLISFNFCQIWNKDGELLYANPVYNKEGAEQALKEIKEALS